MMLFPFVALLGLAAASPVARKSSFASDISITSRVTLEALKEETPIGRSASVLSLTRRKGSSSSSRLLRAARAGNASVSGTYGVSGLDTVAEGQVLITPIEVGGKCFEAVVDTGSSDTWFAKTGFKCKNSLDGSAETQAYCAFGSTYDESSTFSEIPNENFHLTYGDGEYLNGVLGNETVTLANITVQGQTIGVVDEAAWIGDGNSSGLIGLAYPVLTSAYNGTNLTADSRSTAVHYNPIFTNMYEDGQVDSMFTLILERDNGSNTLTLGGLPPATEPGEASLMFTSTDIEIMQLNPYANPLYAKQASYYTIKPDGFVYKNATAGKSNSSSSIDTTLAAIVDSGTPLIMLPTAVVNKVNAAFDPPAAYDATVGYDVVQCNATAPAEFGVTIGGTTFPINPKDMILDEGLGGGKCISGVQDGGGALNILGDVFLRNVIAVFDIGAAKMRFAPHSVY